MDKVLSVARRYDGGSARCNLRDGHTARGIAVPGPNYRARSGKATTLARAHVFRINRGPNQRHVGVDGAHISDVRIAPPVRDNTCLRMIERYNNALT